MTCCIRASSGPRSSSRNVRGAPALVALFSSTYALGDTSKPDSRMTAQRKVRQVRRLERRSGPLSCLLEIRPGKTQWPNLLVSYRVYNLRTWRIIGNHLGLRAQERRQSAAFLTLCRSSFSLWQRCDWKIFTHDNGDRINYMITWCYSAAYSSSVTGSHHSFDVFSPGYSNARWLNQLPACAPCQCFTFAGISTTSPGLSACAGLPSS